MALNLPPKTILKSKVAGDTLKKQPLFTLGLSNNGLIVVNEGTAITSTMNLQVVGLGGNKLDMGVQTNYSIRNKSGASRNVTIIITNETKGTTLISRAKDLGNGGITSASDYFKIEQVADLDFLKLAIGNQGYGSSAGCTSFGSSSFEVKSIFLENA